MAAFCKEHGVEQATHEAYTKGGLGATALAEKVVETIEKNPNPTSRSVYELEDPLEKKVDKVARNVYGASGVTFSEKAQAKLQRFAEWGFAKLPVCIAKTQYSLSDNPKLLGAPTGWKLNVTDASLSPGSGFVVGISGRLMLMPGRPKFRCRAGV